MTQKKIQIIINQLRFKLYTIRDMEREREIYNKEEESLYNERSGRRGR